jgi:hypothetical protein
LARANPAPQRLWFVEAVKVVAPGIAATDAGSDRRTVVVINEGGAAGLLGGDSPQAHAFVGKENGGAGQQKLAELQDRIETPALEKEDPAAEQAYRRKKHVIVPGQGGLEAPHEIEESTAYRQHDADDAGPIEAGINHGFDPSVATLNDKTSRSKRKGHDPGKQFDPV